MQKSKHQTDMDRDKLRDSYNISVALDYHFYNDFERRVDEIRTRLKKCSNFTISIPIKGFDRNHKFVSKLKYALLMNPEMSYCFDENAVKTNETWKKIQDDMARQGIALDDNFVDVRAHFKSKNAIVRNSLYLSGGAFLLSTALFVGLPLMSDLKDAAALLWVTSGGIMGYDVARGIKSVGEICIRPYEMSYLEKLSYVPSSVQSEEEFDKFLCKREQGAAYTSPTLE